MATPLLDILQDLFLNRRTVTEDLLREHGYEDLDAADVQEALLAMAETMPVSESVDLTEVADNLDVGDTIESAVAALQEAQESYTDIADAQADPGDVDGSDLDLDHSSAEVEIEVDGGSAEVDIDIDTGGSESASVDVEVAGDSDPDIEIDGAGIDDIMVTVDGEEIAFDELDDLGEDRMLGGFVEDEPVIDETATDLDFDLD